MRQPGDPDGSFRTHLEVMSRDRYIEIQPRQNISKEMLLALASVVIGDII